jgi:hypothetical protein
LLSLQIPLRNNTIRGLHITSLIRRALEAWIKTEKTLRITKACIVEKEVHLELLATREADFQEIILLSSLFLFLQNQITSIKLILATIITILHWGDQDLLHIEETKPLLVSTTLSHKFPWETTLQPLAHKLSPVRTFLWKSYQLRRDLDG